MEKFSSIVYIIDDHPAMCNSLSWLLDSVHLKNKTYGDGLSFLKDYRPGWQGCILLDVRMPIMSGLQLQEKLIAMKNLMPIIMLSGHGDIDMAVRALKTGACDFITKPFNDQILLEKIQKALSFNEVQKNKMELEKRYRTLTAREQVVMKNIAEGKTNKIIANELNISSKTVESHRAHVMQKMGAKQLASLVRMYYLLETSELKN